MSELQEAIQEMRNMRESYDQIGAAAEAYNTGKTELAANITAKGVQASASETLPELAGKVAQIAQTETIIDGGEMYAAQQFGDGSLWDLYQVLADMKTRFMGTGDYAALIVCEYYKGYDSLALQGADGYYTCDGDYYDYASPTHVWHDADNGKANRWVAFLYRDEGARLDITNTAISPRSMYIGGHIGTIEYFVNGRLTELVSGVEETDVIDNFLTKNYTQEWLFNCTIRGVNNISESNGTRMNIASAGAVVIEVGGRLRSGASYGMQMYLPNAQAIIFKRLESAEQDYGLFNAPNVKYIYMGVSELKYATVFPAYFLDQGTLTEIHLPNLTTIIRPSINKLVAECANLYLLEVGHMETSLGTRWNPTNILADATKKAQLIENIKNHILARISDATGGTQLVFTVSTNMYNEVASEQIEWQGETMSLADAFLTKNWLLAGV